MTDSLGCSAVVLKHCHCEFDLSCGINDTRVRTWCKSDLSTSCGVNDTRAHLGENLMFPHLVALMILLCVLGVNLTFPQLGALRHYSAYSIGI